MPLHFGRDPHLPGKDSLECNTHPLGIFPCSSWHPQPNHSYQCHKWGSPCSHYLCHRDPDSPCRFHFPGSTNALCRKGKKIEKRRSKCHCMVLPQLFGFRTVCLRPIYPGICNQSSALPLSHSCKVPDNPALPMLSRLKYECWSHITSNMALIKLVTSWDIKKNFQAWFSLLMNLTYLGMGSNHTSPFQFHCLCIVWHPQFPLWLHIPVSLTYRMKMKLSRNLKFNKKTELNYCTNARCSLVAASDRAISPWSEVCPL